MCSMTFGHDVYKGTDENVTYRWLFLLYLSRWIFFPAMKLVYAYYPPFWEEFKFKGNYSSLYGFSTERFGHDMKLGDKRKFTKIFLLWSSRFISDMLFTFNRFKLRNPVEASIKKEILVIAFNRNNFCV